MRRLSEEQLAWLDEHLEPDRAAFHKDIGLMPVMGGAPDDEDEEDLDKEEPEVDDPEAKEDLDKEDEDEEEEATDDEVEEFLTNITAIPEIKAALREAARAGADAAGRQYMEVKEEILTSVDQRLDKIKKDLESGDIDADQARTRARRAAEDVIDRANPDKDEPPSDDPDKALTEREKRVRMGELKNIRHDLLAKEDSKKVIPEMVEVKEDTTEEKLEDMIEQSKDVRKRIRKETIAELRAAGWKSPRDRDDDDEDEDIRPSARGRRRRDIDDDEEDSGGPSTRDSRGSGGSLTKKEKANLRSRFGYADPAKV